LVAGLGPVPLGKALLNPLAAITGSTSKARRGVGREEEGEGNWKEKEGVGAPYMTPLSYCYI